MSETNRMRFGSFELDVRSRELRSGADRIRLQEQPFEILRIMLERPGDVVTREELRHRLWPEGTFVDFEHSLNAAVKRLRAALGDNADNPRFVETLPRRGYRFIAALNTTEPVARATAAAAAPRTRLAVLPFSNLSHLSTQDYFTDGLTEELISQLGQLFRDRVGVISRWSSMVFKGTSMRAREVGEALNVDYLLEGSVRRDGDRVRITARLVKSANETNLWSESYERPLIDCLSVQSEVAAQIARSLAMELSPGERVQIADPKVLCAGAYQAYLKGRYYWGKPGDEGLDQAFAYFKQAIGIEPAFGAAHAALARAHIARAENYRELPRMALQKAQQAALTALECNQSLYEAHLAYSDTRRMLEWDWQSSQAAYAQVIARNPSDERGHRSYSLMLTAMGDHQDAIRESELACDLDPLCLTVNTNAAWVRYAAGDYRAALEHCRNTLDMDPEFMPARRMLGAAYLMGGHVAEALAELETATVLSDSDPVLLAWLAHAKATTGARDQAGALVAQLRKLENERYVPAYHLALAYTGLASFDEAFAALDRAWLDRDPFVANVDVEPRFAPLRADPRYAELLERLNIPGYRVHA